MDSSNSQSHMFAFTYNVDDVIGGAISSRSSILLQDFFNSSAR